jgi:hypothetical protein
MSFPALTHGGEPAINPWTNLNEWRDAIPTSQFRTFGAVVRGDLGSSAII